MSSLEGKVIMVTGGSGYLGSAICESIDGAKGISISVSRSVAWEDSDIQHLGGDAKDTKSMGIVTRNVLHNFGHIDGLVNIVGDIEICTEAVKDHVSVIANCVSLWADLAPNPKMYLDLGNEPTPAIVGDKGTRLALTRYYASFLAPKVRVNAFSPGWFPKKRGPERPDYIEEITNRTPLGRIGQPEDIVGTVLFLLSDASRFMTGQNLVVDGGYSIW